MRSISFDKAFEALLIFITVISLGLAIQSTESNPTDNYKKQDNSKPIEFVA